MAEAPRLSPGQLGLIRERFRQLGLGDDERRWRLRATSALLGLPGQLRTTKDLTAVQARWLLWRLAQFGSEAELEDAVAGLEDAVAAVRREKRRAQLRRQLAAVLAAQGAAELPVPLPGQQQEVPGAPGHDAA